MLGKYNINPQREYLERKLFKQHKNKTRFYLMGRDIYKKYIDFQEYLKKVKSKEKLPKTCLNGINTLGFGHWCAVCNLTDNCDIFKKATRTQ